MSNGQTDQQTDRWLEGQMDFFLILQDFIPYQGGCPKRRDRPTDGLMDTPTDVAKDRVMGGQTYRVTVITHN